MIQVTKQFTHLEDALWFIDSEASDAREYNRMFTAQISYVNLRWKVTVETEAE